MNNGFIFKSIFKHSVDVIGKEIDIKLFIFVTTIFILLAYLSFSFVAWELNPEKWSSVTRGFFAIICLGCVFGALIASERKGDS